MNFTFIWSNAILLTLLMDPFGNLPVFVSGLRRKSALRYRAVVIRESCFALAAMLFALILGRAFMTAVGLSPETMLLGGGLILMIMGVKMVFSKFTADPGMFNGEAEHEPFIVPFAIPLICGPGTFALLITIRGSAQAATLENIVPALLLAWLAQMGILLCGKWLSDLLGDKLLDALESLMGLLLTCIAAGMLVRGINGIYHIGPASAL